MKLILKKAFAMLLVVTMFVTMTNVTAFASQDAGAQTTENAQLILDQEVVLSVVEPGTAASAQFTPEEDGIYIFRSVNSTGDPLADLNDADGNWLVSGADDGESSEFKIQISLTANETYFLYATFFNQETGDINVIVEKYVSPIASIEFETVVLTEKMDGYYEYGYNQETDTQELFYKYPWYNRVKYTVYFTDDTCEEVDGLGFWYDDQWNDFSYNDGQAPDNVWQAGSYTVEVSVLGHTAIVPVEIVESPFESIEIQPVTMIAGTGGHVNSEYDEEAGEDREYYHYDWYNYMDFVVNLREGLPIEGTGDSFEYEDSYYQLTCEDDQGYDNRWEAGNTYYATVLFQEERISVPVSIVESPIQDIVVSPITLGCTDGYNDNIWNSETEEYERRFIYQWQDNISCTIVFEDEEITVENGNGFEYDGEWYNFDCTDSQQEEQWEAGNEYFGTISVLGFSRDVPITIQESPIENIVFNDVELIENYDGAWSTSWNEETESAEEYYWYDWTNRLTYTVYFKGDESATYTGSYFYYNDEIYYIEYEDAQSAQNPWTVGNTYSLTVSCNGIQQDISVSIVESPIDRIEVESIELIGNYDGSMCEEWDEETEEYREYYSYDWWNYLSYTVYFKDSDLVYEGHGSWFGDEEGNGYEADLLDNQDYNNQWEAGNTYNCTIKALGYEQTVSVTIIDTPIDRIEFEPIELIGNYDGSMCEEWDEETEENREYYSYDWWNRLSYTVYFKGSDEGFKGNDNCFTDQEGNVYSVAFIDNQGADNQWEAGNTYDCTIETLGYQQTIPVKIVGSPIERIEFEPIEMIENYDGCITTDWDEWDEETEEYREYYGYDWWNRLSYTVYFEGSDEGFVGNSEGFSDAQGTWYELSFEDPQGYGNEWEVGNTYDCTIRVFGYEKTVSVSVVETPIARIEVEPIELIGNYDGSMCEEWDEETQEGYEYYCYDWVNRLSYTVYFKGNDQGVEGQGAWFYDEEGNEYSINWNDDQSYDNQWGIGDHVVTINVLGCEQKVTVSIVESPIDRIEVESIELIENYGGYMSGDWDEETEEYREYYGYDWWNRLSYTVYFKDSDEGFEGNGCYFYDEEGNEYSINWNDDQSYDNQWGIGDHVVTINVLGCEQEVTVSIVENPIERIEVAPIVVSVSDRYLEEGWYGETDEYYEYYRWGSKAEITVYFHGGTQQTLSELAQFDCLFEYNGQMYDVFYFDDQSPVNEWVVGNTYTGIVEILGVEAEVQITVSEFTEDSQSGETGDCYWELDDTVLTIYGEGEMADYGYNDALPWGTDITEVIIGDGVTKIGAFAFFDCTALTSVTISDSVSIIGDYAFFGCYNLNSVTIGSSVAIAAFNLGDFEFGLDSDLVTPEASLFIGTGAFEGCEALMDVWYTGTDRSDISIGADNDCLINATWHYNTCKVEHAYSSYCDTHCNNCEWVRGALAAHEFADATCTEPPTCLGCGVTDGEALGHDYEAVVTAPTCTEDGYTTYTCSVCGDSYVADEVEATGHNHVGAETQAPTCTEDGVTTYTCSCGDSYTEAIPATGHDYEAVVTAPTCTEDGYTTYTCACGDSYVDDEVEATGHNHVGAETQAPTCTEDGVTTYTCSCGDSYTEAIPATGHDYEAVVTAPTCTEDGYTTYTCACGDSYVADEVEATGHTEVVDKAVAATCTKTGLTEGSHCSVCNTVFVAQTVVGTVSHTTVVDKAVAATCTKTGLTEGSHCSACGKTIVAQKVVAALGHTYTNDADTSCDRCNAFAYPGGNTLYKENGTWYHVINRQKVKDTTLVNYAGTWYYVKDGVMNTSNTLVKYNNVWYHVNGGKWVKDTTLVSYGGTWYYVKDGVMNTSNTLVKYNNVWYHVNGGKWVKDTTLVKYNNTWYYVSGGKVNFNYTGKVLYSGKYYNVKNGVKV